MLTKALFDVRLSHLINITYTHIVFAGATPANLQQQHTHTYALSWSAASLQSLCRGTTCIRRLVPCHLRHHSCCRRYAYTHAHHTAVAAVRWPRLLLLPLCEEFENCPRCSGVARFLCKITHSWSFGANAANRMPTGPNPLKTMAVGNIQTEPVKVRMWSLYRCNVVFNPLSFCTIEQEESATHPGPNLYS